MGFSLQCICTIHVFIDMQHTHAMHILLGLLVTNTKETRKVSLHDKKRATAPTAYVRVGGLSGNHFPTKDRKLLLRTFYPGRPALEKSV
jgi:hypothetical protein